MSYIQMKTPGLSWEKSPIPSVRLAGKTGIGSRLLCWN